MPGGGAQFKQGSLTELPFEAKLMEALGFPIGGVPSESQIMQMLEASPAGVTFNMAKRAIPVARRREILQGLLKDFDAQKLLRTKQGSPLAASRTGQDQFVHNMVEALLEAVDNANFSRQRLDTLGGGVGLPLRNFRSGAGRRVGHASGGLKVGSDETLSLLDMLNKGGFLDESFVAKELGAGNFDPKDLELIRRALEDALE